MCHKLLKKMVFFVLSAFLIFSLPLTSFADTRGTMDPDDYLFLTIFRACGVSPGVKVGCWVSLYKGYLSSIGDNAMLSRVEGYASLGWGDTAEGVDEVFSSVKNWLSLSGAYGTDNTEYHLLSSPFPRDYPLFSFSSRVFSEPFSECLIDESEQADYQYLFSLSYLGNNGLLWKQNFYLPKGEEIVGVLRPSVSFYNYCDRVEVDFYKADTSEPSGYSKFRLRMENCSVNPDGSIAQRYNSTTSSTIGSDMCSVMDFPFYMFNSTADMENYFKTGAVNNVFTSSSGFLTSLGEESGLDPDLQGEGIVLTNPTVALPADLSEAAARVEAFQKPLSREELKALLSADGFRAVNGVSYKVEHYRENMPMDTDSKTEWEKVSEETLNGAPGAAAKYTALNLEGYTYVPELTEPEEKEILSDGSLVIRLYYTLNRVSYTVEHYTKDIVSDGKEDTWTLADTETFTGIPGTQAVYSARDYPNYLIDYNLTEPSDCQIPSDGSLVIRLYYKPDPDAVYPYTVEYYKDGECFETVSGTVPMFGDRMVRDYEDFCPKYYLFDRKASTSLPFEVSEENSTIRISYKRDVYATFSYTAEYYKDGELFKSLPGTVSVFNPYVKTCISYCPKGYVLDTTSSTALPFEVPETGGVVKNYYVKQETVFPYTVEYYKDGLRMSAFSGNVPSASPLLRSFPSRCPEYYTLDQERSTPMPYTVPGDGGHINVYYKKDENAAFPYTVECYKDGELVETVHKTVSVFQPAVEDYGLDCPDGYVVDTSSSTPLPYSVSNGGSVIKYYYIEEGNALPYTVTYYKDGKEFAALSGHVPASSPEVKACRSYCPDGYILDEASSDSLPFTVTKDNHTIRVSYIPDPSNPYTSLTRGASNLVNFVSGSFGGVFLGLFLLVLFCLFINRILKFIKRSTSQTGAGKPGKEKKKKSFTRRRHTGRKGRRYENRRKRKQTNLSKKKR